MHIQSAIRGRLSRQRSAQAADAELQLLRLGPQVSFKQLCSPFPWVVCGASTMLLKPCPARSAEDLQALDPHNTTIQHT